MRTILTTALATLWMIAAAAPATAPAAPPPGEGWEPLFNGKDLTGWKVPEGDNGHWKVIDGVIDYDAQSEAKKDRNLWTEASFGDFSLAIDWRFKRTTGLYPMPNVLPDGSYELDADGEVIKVERPNADSGVFVRGFPRAAGQPLVLARRLRRGVWLSQRQVDAARGPRRASRPRHVPTNRLASGTRS